MRRFSTVLLLILLGAAAWGQITLKLEFPGPGPREIWVAPELPKGTMPETVKTEAASIDFAPDAFGPSDRLFILDGRTGNLASRPMSDVRGGWKVAEADFNRIGVVRVRVEHGGQPVEAAGVTLKSGSDSRTAIIDSSSNGEAVFYGVAPGSLQATVTYKTTSGETPDPIKQSTEVALKRSKPEVVLAVSIQDDVATVVPAPAGSTKAGGEEGKAAEGEGGSFFGRLISFLLALAVAAVAVFFGLKWLKANQDKVQTKLTSMGVEIPTPGDGEPDPTPVPNAPIAPPPPAQILLDDSAPDPVGAASPFSGPVATAVSDPRLVSASGDSLPLDEGSLTVGREAGLGLSLINESTVSRQHAEIVRQGTSVIVRDLGSTNGTFVNGVQVTGDVELRPGDQVQFGAVRFRFEG